MDGKSKSVETLTWAVEAGSSFQTTDRSNGAQKPATANKPGINFRAIGCPGPMALDHRLGQTTSIGTCVDNPRFFTA